MMDGEEGDLLDDDDDDQSEEENEEVESAAEEIEPEKEDENVEDEVIEEGVRRNVQQQLQLHESTPVTESQRQRRNEGSRQVLAVNPEKNDSFAPPCEDHKASSTELNALFDEMPIWNEHEDGEDEE